MTATMPEEDVEVAVEKAESCQWGELAEQDDTPASPCAAEASFEALISCPPRDKGVRLAFCDSHVKELSKVELICPNCFTTLQPMVMPL